MWIPISLKRKEFKPMKRVILAFSASFLLLSLPGFAGNWIPIKKGAKPGTPPTFNVLSSTPSSTIIKVNFAGFFVEKTKYGWRVEVPEGMNTMDEGRPELSYTGCDVAMPKNGKPSIVIRSIDWALPGDYKVRMAPKPELEGEENIPPSPIAPNKPYPERMVEVAHFGLFRTVPLASLKIHAFKANGDGKITGAVKSITFEVKHPGSPTAWPGFIFPEEFKPILKATVINYNYLNLIPEPKSNEMEDASNTEYLVITTSSLSSAVTPLVNWRKRSGYKTEVVITSSSSPTVVKGYIQSRFSGGKLKYVLLVGDYAQINWYRWRYENYTVNSDVWYACLTGGSNPDLYPDVGLGRLSGTTTTEISNQVNKILKYEQNPPSGNWFTKTILVAHKQGAPGKYVGCKESIANGPLKTSGWTIYKQYGHQSSSSNAAVSNYINNGVGLVNYRGHGGTTYWYAWNTRNEYYRNSNVHALTNGSKTPIVFNIACYNGNFQYSECLSEAWLRAKGGAVASLAATQPSYTYPNHDYDKELYRAIFQDKLTNIFAFYYKAEDKIIKKDRYGRCNARMYHWMGDSATSLWYTAPKSLTVSHPSSINTGSRTVNISVRDSSGPVNHAKVCLYKGTEVFVVGYTNSSGNVSLNVNASTAGTMLVTVTAKDHRPYMGSISVTTGPSRIPPRFLAAMNVVSGSNYRGELWLVNGNSLIRQRIILPTLFNTIGINALYIDRSSSSTITGYLTTIQRSTMKGDLYKFVITGNRMTSLLKLNRTSFGGGNLAQICVYGGKVYVIHLNSSNKGGIISSVPVAGGNVKQEINLGAMSGYQGIANAMSNYGYYFYVATWNAPSGVEQIWKWKVGTTTATKLCTLPKTKSIGYGGTYKCFGPVNLINYYSTLIAIGFQGDIARISGYSGTIYGHYHTGSWNKARGKYNINLLNSGCRVSRIYTDYWLGSRDGAIDVLVRTHGADKVVRLGTSGSVTAIAYLPGSYGYAYCFGDGGMGSGGYYPVEVYMGTPHPGMTWKIGIYGFKGGIPAIFYLGFSSSRWGSVRLPINLAPYGAPGNYIRVSLEIPFILRMGGIGNGNGRGILSFPIPNNPVFVGGYFYTQWIGLDSTANTLGLVVSNAYYTRIYN